MSSGRFNTDETPMIERRPYLTAAQPMRRSSSASSSLRFPMYVTFVASTVDAAGGAAGADAADPRPPPDRELLAGACRPAPACPALPVGRMMWNSLVMALAISIGKIAISLMSAFAIVYFRFPFRKLAFWVIFVTLMLPVECGSCRRTRSSRTCT
jgi:sn-glycerol 3-phosphate transport system permease protein